MNQSGQDGDLPMHSRSILGGKKTSKIEARVSDNLKEAMRRRWMDMGFGGESEYLETLVTIDCFGKDHVRMIQERRLAMVGGASDNSPTAGKGALS